MVDHVFTLGFYSFFQILWLFSALFVDFQKSRNLTFFLSSKIEKLGTKTALNITLDGILEFRTKFLMFLCIFLDFRDISGLFIWTWIQPIKKILPPIFHQFVGTSGRQHWNQNLLSRCLTQVLFWFHAGICWFIENICNFLMFLPFWSKRTEINGFIFNKPADTSMNSKQNLS